MKTTIIFDKVSKKFSKGYVSDSLRDAIAAPFKSLFSRDGSESANRKDEFWALKDVSFEVKPGEALGIIGPNGCGKSTTLKLLARILRPDEGGIAVKGRVGALIELGAGFHSDLTGRENIFLNASILGMKKDEISKKFDEIVEFAEVQDFIDMPVKWYSSGMNARLGFAIAVHTDPEVLLVDEVLSVGDIGFQKRCMDKMMLYKERGVSVVFVSHNMTAVASVCNRVIVLEHGKITFDGSPHESISYYTKKVMGRDNNNGPISLVKGEIYDSENQKRDNFKCGEKARVKIVMQSEEDFLSVSIGFRLATTEGMLVSKIQTDTMTKDKLSLRKNKQIFFEVEVNLNLAPGERDCFAYVVDKRLGKVIFNKRFAQIVIKGESRALGIAYLRPKLINISEAKTS